MIDLTRRTFVLIILFASLVPLNVFSQTHNQPAEAHGQLSGKQGEVLVVTVSVNEEPIRVIGHFLHREMMFFPVGKQVYAGLVGLDMQDTPGQYDLIVQVDYADCTDQIRMTIVLMKEDFTIQHVTVPKNMVDLDRTTLARVKKESQVLSRAFAHVLPNPLWTSGFREPVQGRISGRFGSRRVLNGQPKRPHSGEDIAASAGTPVVAMTSGMVRLTMNHFFTGKGVVLDHGLGLFSMYFHLSTIEVTQGQFVKTGQPIGAVGATGRATGPHLHWGVRLNGARVDPYSLLNLSLDGPS